jgi:hypothetical protein
MTSEHDRDRLITKGKFEPLRGLLDQSEYTEGVTAEHKAELLAAGLTEELLLEYATKKSNLFALTGGRREGQVDSQMATRREVEAITAAKAHIYKLRQLVPMVVRRTKATDMTAAHIAPSGELRRSSPKIAEHLRKIRNLVVKLETGLAPYFGGRSPTAVHDQIISDLADANRDQEVKRGGLAPESLELYEAKGAMLEIIEDFNRIGRIAFPGRAEIAAKFNKDILLRARGRAKKAKEDGEQTVNEAETETETKEVAG